MVSHWPTLSHCVYHSAYVKLCTVDLVRHCVDSNFSRLIKSNQIDSIRFAKTLTSRRAIQGRRKQFESGRAHGERLTRAYDRGLRAELVRGALPLKLKAFFAFGRPMKAAEFATYCMCV